MKVIEKDDKCEACRVLGHLCWACMDECLRHAPFNDHFEEWVEAISKDKKWQLEAMAPMRRIKLHRIVEYLKHSGFHHDTFDLEAEGIETVLREYGIKEDLTPEEWQQLRRDLYALPEQNEFTEGECYTCHAVKCL